ncbi:MAG TPA: hypothetical protein PLF11_04670 [Bacillota bacterium]|jgi:hypothetical protein|nr:hypothetical protein [Bacillota bacterium]
MGEVDGVGGASGAGIDSGSEEYCAIAFEEATMMCATPELVFVQASKFMGFGPEEIDEMLPLDATYREALSAGVGESILDARRWILARAWDAHVNEGVTVFEAFMTAWQEAVYDLSG